MRRGRLEALVAELQRAQRAGRPRARIRAEDFDAAHARLKADKAPGADGVAQELLRNLEPAACLQVRMAFEALLNLDAGEAAAWPPGWRATFVHALQKPDGDTRYLENWRPIALVPVLSNAFEATLVQQLQQQVHWRCNVLGFRPGHQVLEATELVRLALQKGHEWGHAVAVVTLDVRKAFDSVGHAELDRALEAKGIGLEARIAFGRSLLEAELTVEVAGCCAEGVRLEKGAKQGGRSTPFLWNVLLDECLGPVFESLTERCGLDLEENGKVSHAIWADNVVLLACGAREAAELAEAVLGALRRWRLLLKPSDTRLLLGTARGPAERRALEEGGLRFGPGGAQWMPCVASLRLLGVLLDETGSTACSLHARVAAAHSAWGCRRQDLCNRNRPVHARILYFYSTVIGALLWGSQGWCLKQNEAKLLRGFELRCIRCMLCRRRRPNETFLAHLQRTTRMARLVLDRVGVPSVVFRALRGAYGWAGHVARHPDLAVHRMLCWRDLEWWRVLQAVGTPPGSRHPRTGPVTRWENQFEPWLGAQWRGKAQCREGWAAKARHFIQSRLQSFFGCVPRRDQRHVP